eukprot:CAMPEP_0172942230 /NCGR_PEP_ID=MMETSP1075-20121228/224941_1 /TAXON_ID=2916 /ORGANISM="Ceratium fusus, Strain PA161109" /LENGTH=34 /DNA_ID= /DNA_START= /DNA_END= /DNA_ORIENTATION=
MPTPSPITAAAQGDDLPIIKPEAACITTSQPAVI